MARRRHEMGEDKVHPFQAEADDGSEDTIAGDVYDVYEECIRVHSPTRLFNKDYTLSDLSSNERYFVKEHIRLTNILLHFIRCTTARNRMRSLMMIDVDAVIVLSRAKSGRMVKGGLAFIGGMNKELPSETEDKEPGFFQRLLGRRA